MSKVVIDQADLTIGEMEAAQKLIAKGMGELTALALVWMKRDDPEVTAEDVRKLKGRDIEIIDSSEDEASNLEA